MISCMQKMNREQLLIIPSSTKKQNSVSNETAEKSSGLYLIKYFSTQCINCETPHEMLRVIKKIKFKKSLKFKSKLIDVYHLRLSKPLTQKALKSWESIAYVYLAVLVYCKHLLLVTVEGRTLNEMGMWLGC